MAHLRIQTLEEFCNALQAFPAPAHVFWADALKPPLNAYGLWKALLELVHGAIDREDWALMRRLANLYDAVERAGKKGEMFESSYVAFLEDIALPTDPAKRRQMLLQLPPKLLAAIKADRGLA